MQLNHFLNPKPSNREQSSVQAVTNYRVPTLRGLRTSFLLIDFVQNLHTCSRDQTAIPCTCGKKLIDICAADAAHQRIYIQDS